MPNKRGRTGAKAKRSSSCSPVPAPRRMKEGVCGSSAILAFFIAPANRCENRFLVKESGGEAKNPTFSSPLNSQIPDLGHVSHRASTGPSLRSAEDHLRHR